MYERGKQVGLLSRRSDLELAPALQGVKDDLPVGGVEALISQPDANPLEGGARAATASAVGSMGESLFWLSAASVGALLC